jgi:hypothetical protein
LSDSIPIAIPIPKRAVRGAENVVVEADGQEVRPGKFLGRSATRFAARTP